MDMKTRIKQWGYSLVLRILTAFGLREITACSLGRLLEDVSVENRPDEWDMGRAVGNEAW